jgi:regulator of protease activity HflC (stomatin/prohibitin superfamily)
MGEVLLRLSPFLFPYRADFKLSRDSVTVTVDAVVYYRVHNLTIAVSNVKNFRYRE